MGDRRAGYPRRQHHKDWGHLGCGTDRRTKRREESQLKIWEHISADRQNTRCLLEQGDEKSKYVPEKIYMKACYF